MCQTPIYIAMALLPTFTVFNVAMLQTPAIFNVALLQTSDVIYCVSAPDVHCNFNVVFFQTSLVCVVMF